MHRGHESGRLSLRAIPRTTSTKTHSVIGVSADPHAGTEDWTDGFSLTDQFPATNNARSPTPHSPASQRAAALRRIAKEENAPHRQRDSCPTAASKSVLSSAVLLPAKPENKIKSREAWDGASLDRGGGDDATTATVAGSSGGGGASSSHKGSSGRVSKSTRSSNTSSSRHQKDPKDGTAREQRSRVSRRDREHGKSSSSHRKLKAESGRSRRGPRTSESAVTAEASTKRTHQSHRSEVVSSRSREEEEAKPRRRRSRDVKRSSGHVSSSAGTAAGRDDAMAPVKQDVLDKVNDSPTDSDLNAVASAAAREAGQNEKLKARGKTGRERRTDPERASDRSSTGRTTSDRTSGRTTGSGHKPSRPRASHPSSSQQHQRPAVPAAPSSDLQADDDSEGPVQMASLEGPMDLLYSSREEVVSPSQSAFGLRAYEDEGEDGEGEAPPQAEEDFGASDLGEEDWDTEMGLMEPLVYGNIAMRLVPGGGGGPAGGGRGGSGGGGAEPSPVSAGAGAGTSSEAAQASEAGNSSDWFSDARAPTAYSSTAGASGSDDVDTDWDREFFGTGRTGEPSPNVARDVTRANLAEGLKALLRSAAEDPLDSKARGGTSGSGGELMGVPDKCRVVGRLVRGGMAGPAVTIVKYPRACHLICLRVGPGEGSGALGASTSTDMGGSYGEVPTPSQGTWKGRAMHGQRMVEWLETLISKRAELYRSKSELRAANSRLVKGLRGMDKRLNPQNTKVFLECCLSTWRLGERESSVSILKSFFQVLRMKTRSKAQQGATSRASDTGQETYIMFKHTLKMLEIASLILLPESSLWILSQSRFNGGVERSARSIFGDMLRIACSAFPAYREAFSVVELRAAAHHLGDIVAAGNNQQGVEDASSADSSMVSFTDYGKRRGMMGRGGWGDASQEEWGVEYAWVAQGGASRHQVPTFVERMPQAICTNYLRVFSRAVRVGAEKASLSGSVGSRRGSGESVRGGARSPGLPSPNTLLKRSLSSSSVISRVSSNFPHFNSNVTPEVQLPNNFRWLGSGADPDEAARAFDGAPGRLQDKRDGRSDGSNGAKIKHLLGGGAGVVENASRTAKSKTQWGWPTVFGKRATTEEKRTGVYKGEVQASYTGPSANAITSRSSAAAAATQASYMGSSNNANTSIATAMAHAAQAAATAKEMADVATAAANAATSGSTGTTGTALTFGDRDKSRGGSTGGHNIRSRDVEPADPSRKTAETRRQAGRRLAGEAGIISREPGGERERDRGVRSAAEQRSGVDHSSVRDTVADARARDRKPRQIRSVESPRRTAAAGGTSIMTSTAALSVSTAAEVTQGGYSGRGSGGKQQRHGGNRGRSASPEIEVTSRRDRREQDREHRVGGEEKKSTRGGGSGGGGSGHHRFSDVKERGHGDTRPEVKRRPAPIQVEMQQERETSRRPSRSDRTRTRTRSEERISSSGRDRREGQQWSDLANPRPPLPHPSPAPDSASAAGQLKGTGGGGKGGLLTSSPANSSNAASDEKGRMSRVDDNSSSAGRGTSSLAGWGETMAAEAEAEVLGRSHRGGIGSGNKQGGGVGGAAGRAGDNTEETGDPTLRGQPERTRLHQMVAALTDLCLYLFGVSPLTMEDCPSMLDHLPNDDDDWDEDDTFDESSIFSGESGGSINTISGHGYGTPSSPSTAETILDHSDDDEEDEELRSRWGNDGVIVGGAEEPDAKPGHQRSSDAVVPVTEILRGWDDCEAPVNDSANPQSGDQRGTRLSSSSASASVSVSRAARATSSSSTAEGSGRPFRRTSTRSIAGWSSSGGVQGHGAGGGGGKASIVSALERAMSRSTYGGGNSGIGAGAWRGGEVATPQPQRQKKLSEEMFGAFVGQDAPQRRGSWALGAEGGKVGGGASGAGKGEDGKTAEVDLGFLLREDGVKPYHRHLTISAEIVRRILRVRDTVSEGDDVRALASLSQPEDAGAYLELLMPSYKALPEDCIQKARAAFAMGILAAKKDDLNLAEALHLEAVLVLDRLPEEETGSCPLISPFGVHCLEKLGDILLKNGKYEYGILALERATECYWEYQGRSKRYEKLVRRVTRITREHGDTKRALMYHSRMLQAAKKGGNLNEFVYLAKEISWMLKEEGWYLEAESYLAATSRLLAGLRLDKIVLRDRTAPVGVGISSPRPGDEQSNGWREESGWSAHEGGGPLDGNDPGPAMVPILEHVDARAGNAVPGNFPSGTASGSSMSGGVLSGGSVGLIGSVGGGGGSGSSTMGSGAGLGSGVGVGVGASGMVSSGVMSIGGAGGDNSSGGGGLGVALGGGMAAAGLSGGGNMGGALLGETTGRLRGDSIAAASASENLSFETAFVFGAVAGGGGAGIGVGGSGGGMSSPTPLGPSGGFFSAGGIQGSAIETQQYELQMRMVDILMVSLQYARALSLLNNLLRRKIKSGQRSLVLFLVAKCYLKLRKVAACEAALERIVLEANEALGTLTCLGRTTSDQTSVGSQHRRNASGGGTVIPMPGGAVLPSNVTVIPMQGSVWPGGGSGSVAHGDSMAGDKSVSTGGGGGGGGLAGLGGDNYVYDIVTMVKNVDFLVLRARCSIAAGDPTAALQWVRIALAVSTDSRQLGNEGRLMYLRGRCYQLQLVQAIEEESLDDSPSTVPPERTADDMAKPAASKAAKFADKAEEAYDLALDYFRSADDVYHQAKCMARSVEMQLSRIFADVAIRRIPLKEAAMHQAEGAMKGLESRAASSLGLAGDAGEPLLLVLALLNAAEFNWLKGRVVPCYQAWKEAAGLLSLIHLQRQEVAPAGHGGGPCTHQHGDGNGGGTGGSGSGRSAENGRKSHRLVGTPLKAPAYPTVSFPPSIMLKIHGLLHRASRLVFVLSGPPPAQASPVLSNPLVAAALPNSTYLLAGWALLDGWVKLYPSQDKARKPKARTPAPSDIAMRQAHHKKHHRRGGRRFTRTGGQSNTFVHLGQAMLKRSSRSSSPPSHANPPSPTTVTDTEASASASTRPVSTRMTKNQSSYDSGVGDAGGVPSTNINAKASINADATARHVSLRAAAAASGGGGGGGDDTLPSARDVPHSSGTRRDAASAVNDGTVGGTGSSAGGSDPSVFAALASSATALGVSEDPRPQRKKVSRESFGRSGGGGYGSGQRRVSAAAAAAGREGRSVDFSSFPDSLLMAPLAKPMAPFAPSRERGISVLPRSSSLEGSTVSDALRPEGGSGADALASIDRRDTVTGQGRPRGHVRKLSDGTSYRGHDDTSSRRAGMSREENLNRLVQEYDKVLSDKQEQSAQSRSRPPSDRLNTALREGLEISLGVGPVSEDDVAKRTSRGRRSTLSKAVVAASKSPPAPGAEERKDEVHVTTTDHVSSLSDSGSPVLPRTSLIGQGDPVAKAVGRPSRMSRFLNNPWASRARHPSPSAEGRNSASVAMTAVPEDGGSSAYVASVGVAGVGGGSSYEAQVQETPHRRRATRSGVMVSAMPDAFSGLSSQQHNHTRSMSSSLEAVGRAIHFSGLGKEVTQAVANAKQAAVNRERMSGVEASRSTQLCMDEFGLLTEVIPELEDTRDGNLEASTAGGTSAPGASGLTYQGGPQYRFLGPSQEGSRAASGIGESSFEYSEERMLSARERPVEHRARPRISMGTLLAKAPHTTTRTRDRIDSLSWVPEGGLALETPAMSTSTVSTGTAGVGGGMGGGGSSFGINFLPSYNSHGVVAAAGIGGTSVAGWRRSYVRAATPATQAGYGVGLVAGLEHGMSGEKRALWGCFCSFKTRRRSYTTGLLTLHDLHEKNLEAMQFVVDLGRQLGRPIFTSLWSSRANRPSAGSASGSRGSPGMTDLGSSGHRRTLAGSSLDVNISVVDSGGISSASGGGGGGGAGGGTSRSLRRGTGGTGANSGILSEFALSALSANGGSDRSGGGGGGGGGSRSDSASGGRGSALSQQQQHHQQQHHHHHQHHYYHHHQMGSPQPLSPAVRAGAPPGSMLSSFASPGTASWRSSARSWQMYEEEMDALDEEAISGGKFRASPKHHFPFPSESRRGRGSMLTQTMTLSRRSNKGGGVSTGANTYAGSGGSGRSGGGGSAKAAPREGDLRKILQSRHPFPPNFYLLLYMDRSYLYYSPFSGERLMLPVSSSRVILPPSSKQLRVRPDGGVGPIPLYTGWTLGPVPKHIAAWAHASKRAHADGSLDPQSSSHGLSADSAEVRGGDALLASISNGTPGARLPLVPCPDETFVSRDTGVTVLVERLTPPFALFLVTALMLEQPVLLVTAPGSDELLMHAASGLLRLLRPFEWQYLHVPLLPTSCQHVLKHAVDAKEPFLIGTYTSVLESIARSSRQRIASSLGSSARRGGSGGAGGAGKGSGEYSPPPSDARESSGGGGSSNIPPAALYQAHSLSDGGNRHVTVVDLSRGEVYPSKALELAAACTIGPSLDVDADPMLRSHIFSHFRGTHGNRAAADRSRTTGWGWSGGGSSTGTVDPGDYDTVEANASMAMLPAIPCRYRYQLVVRLQKQDENTPGVDTRAHNEGLGVVRGPKSRPKPYGGGGGGGGGGGFEYGSGTTGVEERLTTIKHLLENPVYCVGDSRLDGNGTGRGVDVSLMASRTGEVLRQFLFNMMVNFLKGYHIFIRPPDSNSGEETSDDAVAAGGSAAARGRGGGGGASGGGERAGQGQENDVEFDVLGFLSFTKADLRPFVRVLLRTKAFAAFLGDARAYCPSSRRLSLTRDNRALESSADPHRGKKQRRERRDGAERLICLNGARHSGGTTSAGGDGFRQSLERAITVRMQDQTQIHRNVRTERMGAYLLMYFTNVQPVAPTASADLGGGLAPGGGMFGGPLSPTVGPGGGGGGGGISRAAAAIRARTSAPKVKKRWCVLDAMRFTYYRTRSKTKVKDHVPLDPRNVVLVTPPFIPSRDKEDPTSERDAVALVCFEASPERDAGTLVIRAEQVGAQEVWVHALAARLTSKDHNARMAELYGDDVDD